MKLSRVQVNAIADTFVSKRQVLHNKESERLEKEQWDSWRKTPDGKLHAKLPDWIKERLDEWHIENSAGFKALAKKPTITVPSITEVRSQVIILAMTAKTVPEINASLEEIFK